MVSGPSLALAKSSVSLLLLLLSGPGTKYRPLQFVVVLFVQRFSIHWMNIRHSFVSSLLIRGVDIDTAFFIKNPDLLLQHKTLLSLLLRFPTSGPGHRPLSPSFLLFFLLWVCLLFLIQTVPGQVSLCLAPETGALLHQI